MRLLIALVVILLVSLACKAERTHRDYFTKFVDQDADNRLSLNELKAYDCRNRTKSCHVSDAQAKYVYSRLDADHSGSVSFEELEKVMDPIEGGPQQVHLALTDDPTEMVVMWITRDQLPSVVQYGPQSHQYPYTTNGITYTYDVGVFGWNGWIHQVILKGLTTNTRYYYQVGSTSQMSNEFNFITAPAPTDAKYTDNVIAVLGDMGTVIPMGWAVTEQLTSDNAKTPFSFVLHAGDVAYAGTGSEWEWEEIWDTWGDQVQPIAAYVPYMFAVGNHEHYYNYTSFRSRFLMPGAQSGGNQNFWYSINYGNIHFTFMSTEHDYTPGSVQYKWLEQDLATANQNRASRPWIVLSGHRPMYNSDSEEWNQHSPGASFQHLIEPLFLKYKVDIYLSGHMHMYERVYPNINGTVVAKGNTYTNPTAPAYVVQGTGGVFMHDPMVEPQPVWSAMRSSASWGYGRMTINQKQLTYQFYSEETNTVVDQFVIIKN